MVMFVNLILFLIGFVQLLYVTARPGTSRKRGELLKGNNRRTKHAEAKNTPRLG